MKNILITGGPVHAYLDAVKLITNKFKGGLMAELADQLLLYRDCNIIYLTTKGSRLPQTGETDHLRVLYHDGFEDYCRLVSELTPKVDAVILGAAVANLIPLTPLKGKFPSHNYKVGDVIPINFTIAPRIIENVKKVNPKVHLFGFKLLSGVPHDELIAAAYEIVLASHATAVFANDATNLGVKYAVTKERAEHQMNISGMVKFISDVLDDVYYNTTIADSQSELYSNKDVEILQRYYSNYSDKFPTNKEGYVFGTIAVKNENGILTTSRGKREFDSLSFVSHVDHNSHIVTSNGNKATLNAPLLDWLFSNVAESFVIIHYHEQRSDLPTLKYAFPGTVRDSQRNVTTSFNIENHGCFLLFDKEGKLL